MSVIAFSIVFLVIGGLMLVMMLLKFVSSASGETSKPEVKLQPVAVGAPAQNLRAPADDGELAAVITAAISASMGAGVKVLSFSQTRSRIASSVWRMNARIENLEGFAD
jgi:Na+-transporting methylmalonyl-CoA/oxaloacetate decarboxylase gamma subunit